MTTREQTQEGQPESRLAKKAVARREAPPAVTVAHQYEGQISEVLPSFIEVKGFIGQAIATLRKNPALLAAANNDLTRFIGELIECARLGHVPGSKEFYLTIRNEKVGTKWVPKVMGIEGYRGVIDRMYRSGAVASVKIREVCVSDDFEFIEGVHDKPIHRFDPFSDIDRADPANIIGVYAYAILLNGAVSRVVLLSKKDLDNTKARSDAGKADKGPWTTDYRAMAWKTAAHRLEPWVPTSSEYRAEALRQSVAAESVREREGLPPGLDMTTGEIHDQASDADDPNITDAVLVDEASPEG